MSILLLQLVAISFFTTMALKEQPGEDGTMNALRFHGQHDLRFERIPIPKVKAGQVKVKPAWVGICGTGVYLNNTGKITSDY